MMRFPKVLFLVLFFVTDVSSAELSSREKRMIDTVNLTVRKAGASFQAGKFDESAEHIRRAIKQIEIATSTASADVYDAMLPAMKRVATAHAMLELEGLSLPPFRRPARPEPKPDVPASMPKTSSSETQTPTSPMLQEGLSFTNQVAPILVNRCGKCHIDSIKGQFSMANFDVLMKGPPEGVVIFAGDVVGSRLIETIKTGDMPRGGGKVSPDELKVLEAWIQAGAKFDGDNPAAPLGGGSPTATPVRRNQPTIKRATGDETFSFAADVAPLLVANCNGCHIGAMQDKGGLRMDTFAQLLRGGDSGEVITPGKGSESLIIQKLRGMGEGERMPAGGRPALSEEAIQLITTWIDEGAALDGASETQPIPVMAQLAWAATATDQQMSKKRAELARNSLDLVAASAPATMESTEHFNVVGTAAPQTLQLVAQAAEHHMQTVRTVVQEGQGEAFFHGRATIFVLPRRYDYSEFAKMVERRAVPPEWTAHWKFDGVDAYVAMVATDRDDEETIQNRLLEPLVSLAVATRAGDVPRWFAQGVGTTIASRMNRSDDAAARDRQRAEMIQAVAVTEDAKKFLEDKLTPEQSDLVGAAVMGTMLDPSQRKYFDKLIRQLSDSNSFDKSFEQTFRMPVVAYVDNWLKRVQRP
jgi:hypothetical protein